MDVCSKGVSARQWRIHELFLKNHRRIPIFICLNTSVGESLEEIRMKHEPDIAHHILFMMEHLLSLLQRIIMCTRPFSVLCKVVENLYSNKDCIFLFFPYFSKMVHMQSQLILSKEV